MVRGDLVPRSRFGGSRTKKQGRGEGKGEKETRSGKIRLRGPESGPRVNCACPKSDMLSCVQYRHRVRYRVEFCFKKRGSLNFKPKTQALICFEGCSAAGQHVLTVLPTGYGKNWTGRSTSSCCQTCRKSECFSVLRWKSRVYHNCCLAVIGPDTPYFGFEQE